MGDRYCRRGVAGIQCFPMDSPAEKEKRIIEASLFEGGVICEANDGGSPMSLKYNGKNIPFAKQLRKNATPQENRLWYDFLRKYPIRFQRQKAIGNYIVDFYCAKAKLVIELDGGGHYTDEQELKDKLRTNDLEAMDLKIVRISNLDIDRNFRGVCEYIDLTVKNLSPSQLR